MDSLTNTQEYTMRKVREGYKLKLETVGHIKRVLLWKKGETLEDVPYRTVMVLVAKKYLEQKGDYFVLLEPQIW